MDTREEWTDNYGSVAVATDTHTSLPSDKTQHAGTAKQSTAFTTTPTDITVVPARMATVTVTATHTVAPHLQPSKSLLPSYQYPVAPIVPALVLLISLCYSLWQIYKFQHWRAGRQRAANGLRREPQSLLDRKTPAPVPKGHTELQPATDQPYMGADIQRIQGQDTGSIAGRAEAGLLPHPKESPAMPPDTLADTSRSHRSDNGKKSEVLEQAVQGVECSKAVAPLHRTGVVQRGRRSAPVAKIMLRCGHQTRTMTPMGDQTYSLSRGNMPGESTPHHQTKTQTSMSTDDG